MERYSLRNAPSVMRTPESSSVEHRRMADTLHSIESSGNLVPGPQLARTICSGAREVKQQVNSNKSIQRWGREAEYNVFVGFEVAHRYFTYF